MHEQVKNLNKKKEINMTSQDQVLNPNEANMPQQNQNVVINQNVVVGQAEKKKSILGGAGWMAALLLFLFWIPLLGAFLAGFVGGRKAGDVGSALLAVLALAVALPIVLLIVGSGLSSLPLVGAILGASSFLFFFAEIIPLLIGAVIGGATAN
jgi:hypothetical protein